MSLYDLMGHAGLAGYAEVALVLFLAVFVGVVAWVYWPTRRQEMDRASRLPLEDDGLNPSRPGAKS
jgi:cytochrome c oxidase cbb3-type subunit IV